MNASAREWLVVLASYKIVNNWNYTENILAVPHYFNNSLCLNPA
jgi:hypothetical protein